MSSTDRCSDRCGEHRPAPSHSSPVFASCRRKRSWPSWRCGGGATSHRGGRKNLARKEHLWGCGAQELLLPKSFRTSRPSLLHRTTPGACAIPLLSTKSQRLGSGPSTSSLDEARMMLDESTRRSETRRWDSWSSNSNPKRLEAYRGKGKGCHYLKTKMFIGVHVLYQ